MPLAVIVKAWACVIHKYVILKSKNFKTDMLTIFIR